MKKKLVLYVCIMVILIQGCGERPEHRIEYYPSGEKKTESFYLNGKKNGRKTDYYSNGGIKLIENYRNDTLNGDQLEYSENGLLLSKAYFENGIENGPFALFYDNGYIAKNGCFKNGLLYGSFYEFFSNDSGKVKIEEYIINAENKEFQYFIKEYNIKHELVHEGRSICFDSLSSLDNKKIRGTIRFCDPLNSFDSLKLVLGNFGNDFIPLSNLDTFKFENNVINFTSDQRVDDSLLRGKVLGYKTFNFSDSVKKRTSFYFFEEKLRFK